jgi:putative monooxygenase
VSNTGALKISAKDVAANNRQGGENRALLTPNSVGATAGFTGTQRLEPGAHISEHYHPYSDEFVYVVEGTLRITVDGDELDLGAAEAVMFRRGQRHRVVNVGDTPAFFVYHISPLAPRPEFGHVDTEEVPNPDSTPPKVGGPR